LSAAIGTRRGESRLLPAASGRRASQTAETFLGSLFAVRSTPVNTKGPLSIAVSEPLRVGASGLEPPTPSLSSKGTSDASEAGKELASTPPAVCTSVCTSQAENANAGTTDAHQGTEGEGTASAAASPGAGLAELAAALLTLSPADRARLAAIPTGTATQGQGRDA